MKRKLISFILTLCILTGTFSIFAVTASAESSAYAYIMCDKAKEGSTIEIPIRVIEGNSNGIACLIFSPQYNHSVMTLKSITSEVGAGTFLYNEDSENPKFLWYDTQNHHFANENNECVFTMTFEISEEVTPGYYPISLEFNSSAICDENGNIIALNVEAGQLYIFRFLLGDANNDLSVSAADVVYLARYLLGMETEIHTESADINQDSMIDGRDLVKLARHMVNAEVVPGILPDKIY